MTHVLPEARVTGQLLVWIKSPATEMAIPVSAVDPLLLSVLVIVTLFAPITVPGKLRDEGLSVAPGTTPGPESCTDCVCVPPPALFVKARVPLRVPVAVGVKV